MDYNKINFEDGQILKAEHLNHMQDGMTNLNTQVVDDIRKLEEEQLHLGSTIEEIEIIEKEEFDDLKESVDLLSEQLGNIPDVDELRELIQELDQVKDNIPEDFTDIKVQIQQLKQGKADKTEIPEPYDDTKVKDDIQQLEQGKADKTEIPAPYDDTDVKAAIQELKNNPVFDENLTHRIENLEAYASGDWYREDVDAGVAYEKAVPIDARPWCSLDSIGVKTLTWNQLLPSKSVSYSGDVYSLTGQLDGELTLTLKRDTDAGIALGDNPTSITVPLTMNGHKVLKVSTSDFVTLVLKNPYMDNDGTMVFTNTTTFCNCTVYVKKPIAAGTYKFSVGVFDLTAMFGAEDAATMTAEEFLRMFPRVYYPYWKPALLSFGADRVISRGRNLLQNKQIVLGGWAIIIGQDNANTFETYLENGTTYYISVRSAYDKRIVFYYNKDGVTNMIESVNGEAGLFSSVFTYNQRSGPVRMYLYPESANADDIADVHDFMLAKSNVAVPFVPYSERIITNLRPLVQKYFPSGMHSVGTVYDEIDLERGVAIQRVGFLDITKFPQLTRYTYDDGTGFYYFYDSNNTFFTKGISSDNRSVASDSNVRYVSYYAENGQVRIYVKDSSVEPTGQYAYVFDEPVRTPISDVDLAGLIYLKVEAGGALSFVNYQGTDYRVPMPNRETFVIKLGGAMT